MDKMAGTGVSITFDCPDDTDEGFDQGDFSGSSLHDDESLAPLVLVKKCAQSEVVFDRHLVPRVVQDLFRTAPADVLTKDLPEIMKLLTEMGEESLLRADLLENIPNIAAEAAKNSSRVSALKDVVSEYLIPLVVRNLGCSDTSIDKAAQATLIHLIEKGFISKFLAEIKVCPAILALSKMESHLDVVNTGAVTLMSRLAPLLGRDITERIFLKRFSELCASNMFCVRKVSAGHLGNFCAVVGKDAFEKILLPCYTTLCQDDIWGVRKACAEVIMFVSSVCSSDIRRNLLAPIFLNLLKDECRWVRVSAYLTLGPFISTFAVPAVTKLAFNAAGEVVLINEHGSEFMLPSSSCFLSHNPSMSSKDEAMLYNIGKELFWSNERNSLNRDLQVTDLDDNGNGHLNEQFGKVTLEAYNEPHEVKVEPQASFNELELKPAVVSGLMPMEMDATVCNSKETFGNGNSEQGNNLEDLFGKINLDSSLKSVDNEVEGHPNFMEPEHSSIEGGNAINNQIHQVIVPQELVDHFVSMTNAGITLDDSDITYHCAYSLPAVVLTLGKENWLILHNTIELLSGDMQYKVRKTVASSLHEIALILGPEMATKYLTPLFDGFLKDLDEVRIGVLKHLADFLHSVSHEKRIYYLPRLGEFLRVDNVCNWRFKETLAEQLRLAVRLYDPGDIVKHIGHFAQALMLDSVAAVRQAALLLVTEILRHISMARGLASTYLTVIAERFAHSKKWRPRQTYALLCEQILSKQVLPLEEFTSEVLPHLLDLSWDPVSNVRLIVGVCLREHMLTSEYFMDPINEHHKALENVLRRLQADKDNEVRRSVMRDTRNCSL